MLDGEGRALRGVRPVRLDAATTRRRRARDDGSEAGRGRPPRDLPEDAALGGGGARAAPAAGPAAVPAERARRAGDELVAPAARPRLDLGHQVGRELGARRRDRRRPPPAWRCPTTSGPRGVGSTSTTGSPPSARFTVSVSQPASPPRGATTRRDGRSICGSGTDGSPGLSRWTPGSGQEETPNALPGRTSSGAGRCSARVDSPATLPSHAKTCSSASSSASSEASSPADGRCGAAGRGQRGQHGRGERRQRGPVHGDALACRASSAPCRGARRPRPEPLRLIADHAAAGLEARTRAPRPHDRPAPARRLEERVDPALGVDAALRPQAEHEDHRRLMLAGPIRCLSVRVIGHNLTIVTHRRALVRSPGAGTM